MTTAISAFRPNILSDVIGCPRLVVDQAIADSIIQVCKDAIIFQQAFEHDVDASVDVDITDNDAITIDLSDYISDTLRPWDIRQLKIEGTVWDTFYKELENDVEDLSLYQISGTKFFNFPGVQSIKIFPMDTTDDVRVYLDMSWLPLRTMTTVDDRIYNNHRQSVESYARWLLMSQPNKQWTNVKLADYHLAQYSRTSEVERIQRMQGFTFGSMRVKSQRLF